MGRKEPKACWRPTGGPTCLPVWGLSPACPQRRPPGQGAGGPGALSQRPRLPGAAAPRLDRGRPHPRRQQRVEGASRGPGGRWPWLPRLHSGLCPGRAGAARRSPPSGPHPSPPGPHPPPPGGSRGEAQGVLSPPCPGSPPQHPLPPAPVGVHGEAPGRRRRRRTPRLPGQEPHRPPPSQEPGTGHPGSAGASRPTCPSAAPRGPPRGAPTPKTQPPAKCLWAPGPGAPPAPRGPRLPSGTSRTAWRKSRPRLLAAAPTATASRRGSQRSGTSWDPGPRRVQPRPQPVAPRRRRPRPSRAAVRRKPGRPCPSWA